MADFRIGGLVIGDGGCNQRIGKPNKIDEQ